MNEKKVCKACGTQFPASDETPTECPICLDDRQYVPESGQEWTTHDELKENFRVEIRQINERLFELKMYPEFAIAQRALLVVAPEGNILWDCIPLLDAPTVEFINSKGGLKAIAFSHPHFYSTMNDWAEVFDCPVYIHEADERWIIDQGERVQLWSGAEMHLWNEMKLINVGGHFPGSSILHVPFLGEGRGAILCGDTFVIAPSRRHLAAMHSYPNRIPLPVTEIRRIKDLMSDVSFDTIHAWHQTQSIESDAKSLLDASLARYI